MEKKYLYFTGVAALIVGIAFGYTIGVRQTLKLLGKTVSPNAYQGIAPAPKGTVPGYKNPFSVYKNPFR